MENVLRIPGVKAKKVLVVLDALEACSWKTKGQLHGIFWRRPGKCLAALSKVQLTSWGTG